MAADDEPATPAPPDALRAAGERALARLAERRATADPSTAAARELRATLSRAETQIEAIRDATTELRAVLPTRVEAAVARALTGHEGASLARRLDETRDLAGESAAALRMLGGELERERVSRLEDMEVMVDLIARGIGSVRGDVQRVDRRIAALEAQLTSLAGSLEQLAPLVERSARAADRPLRFTLDRDAEGA